MDYSPTVKKVKNLIDVHRCSKEGMTPQETCKELGLDHKVVKSYLGWLEELGVAVLSVEELAARRSEIDLEYLEAISEAKSMYYDYKEEPKAAKTWHDKWMDTVSRRRDLYKLNEGVQIPQANNVAVIGNQQNNYTLTKEEKENVADAIIEGKIVTDA